MNSTALNILTKYWGFPAFRPMQEQIIDSVMEGNDALALFPTGGGKSICFQVPALAREGLCLVISPLIALMKDQVEQLRKKGITAFAITSAMSRREVINTLKVASSSNCKFLYVSPERLETTLFKEYLLSLAVSLIAVDEAHCISQWGYDFRPPYLRIAALREALPDVPVLALTASATPEVQRDICEKLGFGRPLIFRQSFERANLSYSAFEEERKLDKIQEVLRNVEGSSIVYCRSRWRTREISDELNARGIVADFYHGGLRQDIRSLKQEAWIQNQVRVMVCTNAFGMGIDKPDVRTVIHADMPDCLENYYQEAGRAGRDGKKSYAVLLYNSKEIEDLRSLPGIHFPEPAQIRLVYQGVMNYLQVPAGSGQGQYYDFDIQDFTGKFRFDKRCVVYSLKALEQEEILAYSEQVFAPSRIQFTVSREFLQEFEDQTPLFSPVIDTLLRNYGGIFNQPVAVFEKSIAYLMRRDLEQVIGELHQLHEHRIIRYAPQKDNPQLYFIQNHIAANNLPFDLRNYANRKKRYGERIGVLIEYALQKESCRSRIIAQYFGDEQSKPCGICDNCLKKRRL